MKEFYNQGVNAIKDSMVCRRTFERGGGVAKKHTDRFGRRYLIIAHEVIVKPEFILRYHYSTFVTKLNVTEFS